MRRIKALSITAGQRYAVGCIATMVDEKGVERSRHFVGDKKEATSAVAEYCDYHNLKIKCLSTPYTIFRDLAGSRKSDADSVDATLVPEYIMLGYIKRLDLLA